MWLGDLVARKNSHEDTRTQRFHKENQLKKTSPKKRSSGTSGLQKRKIGLQIKSETKIQYTMTL